MTEKEIEMEKHANTFFPGDPVYGSVKGQKTASTRSGKVVGSAEEDGSLKLRVEWDDGTESYESPGELQKK